MVISATTGNSFLDSYARQINILEADPNATADYDAGLEKEFDAIRAQVLGTNNGATPPSGSTQDTPPSTDDGGGPKVLAATGGGNSGSSTTLSSNLPPELAGYRQFIEDAASKTGVDPNLLAAMILQESSGDPNATSTNPGNGKTDIGLMQIDPDALAQVVSEHPELAGKSLFDPQTNILAGAYFVEDQLKTSGGNVDTALRLYNSGSTTVTPGTDANYVTEVDSKLAKLEAGQSL